MRPADVALAAPLGPSVLPSPIRRRIGLLTYWDDESALWEHSKRVSVEPDDVEIPGYLRAFCWERGASGARWLQRIPMLVASFAERWALDLDRPLGDPPGAAAWIAPGRLGDGTDVVLKGWPHPEAQTEAAGLRFFDGRGAARLLASDDAQFVLLLERIQPGDDVWSLEVDHAAEVVVDVVEHLWRPPRFGLGISTLADTVVTWERATRVGSGEYPPRVVQRAISRARSLLASSSAADGVVLHGDLNPYNILRSCTGTWVAIDPKPLIGERAHDLAQYLGNRVDGAMDCADPEAELIRQIDFYASALELDPARIAGWAAVKAIAWDWGLNDAVLFASIADTLSARR